MPHLPARRRRVRRTVRLLAAATLVAAAAACSDPLEVDATRQVVSNTLVVAALSGSAPLTPSALLLPTRGGSPIPTAIAPELTNGDFDVAVDITAGGQPVLYPSTLVDRRAPRRVGMRTVTQPFDSLLRAPGDGYQLDSALVTRVGQTVSVQVPLASSTTELCVYAQSRFIYSKLVVDSVSLPSRLVYLRVVTDPNCGFRSFAAGIPNN